jgi:hypothetical protein
VDPVEIHARLMPEPTNHECAHIPPPELQPGQTAYRIRRGVARAPASRFRALGGELQSRCANSIAIQDHDPHPDCVRRTTPTYQAVRPRGVLRPTLEQSRPGRTWTGQEIQVMELPSASVRRAGPRPRLTASLIRQSALKPSNTIDSAGTLAPTTWRRHNGSRS